VHLGSNLFSGSVHENSWFGGRYVGGSVILVRGVVRVRGGYVSGLVAILDVVGRVRIGLSVGLVRIGREVVSDLHLGSFGF
jgi:hypothetical protein